jgi:hypothetical protein
MTVFCNVRDDSLRNGQITGDHFVPITEVSLIRMGFQIRRKGGVLESRPAGIPALDCNPINLKVPRNVWPCSVEGNCVFRRPDTRIPKISARVLAKRQRQDRAFSRFDRWQVLQ